MVVLAPHLRVGVRRRTVELDGYGTPRTSGHGPLERPRGARVVSVPEVDSSLETGTRPWVLAIDDAFWPIAAGDWLVESGGQGRVWTVVSAVHRPSVFPGGGAVSYIRVEATLNGS